MFNPLYPFTADVLTATINRGCLFFVRNTCHFAFDHFHAPTAAYLVMTHYNEEAKARAHFHALAHDRHRFFYDWNDPGHRERLAAAAAEPPGYKLYSTYFLPDYKEKISRRVKQKVNEYMYKHTDWKPLRGETVNLDFYMQFGDLYCTMRYAGQQIKVRFEDIETDK